MRPNLKHPAYVILYAAVTSAIFTGAIMTLHVATADIVERNEKLLEDKALLEIFFGPEKLDELSDREIAQFIERRIDRETVTDPQTGQHVIRLSAYDADRVELRPRDADSLVGYGFPISGIGFWARIDGLLAITPDLKRIKGIYFLKHSETPGLGGRITSERFRRSFAGLDVSSPRVVGKFIYIGGDKPSSQADPKYNRWVDAITGATGTSRAVEKFLNEHIAQFLRAMNASSRVRSTESR